MIWISCNEANARKSCPFNSRHVSFIQVSRFLGSKKRYWRYVVWFNRRLQRVCVCLNVSNDFAENINRSSRRRSFSWWVYGLPNKCDLLRILWLFFSCSGNHNKFRTIYHRALSIVCDDVITFVSLIYIYIFSNFKTATENSTLTSANRSTHTHTNSKVAITDQIQFGLPIITLRKLFSPYPKCTTTKHVTAESCLQLQHHQHLKRAPNDDPMECVCDERVYNCIAGDGQPTYRVQTSSKTFVETPKRKKGNNFSETSILG